MRRVFFYLCATVLCAATVAAQNPPQQSGLPEESDQMNFWIGTWRVGSVGTATDKVKKLGRRPAIDFGPTVRIDSLQIVNGILDIVGLPRRLARLPHEIAN